MEVETINEIVGKVPVSVEQLDDGERLLMKFADGSGIEFYPEADFGANVLIEDVTGDWSDLIGHPILVAEERSQHSYDGIPEGCEAREESDTWTFYTFRGVGGSVDVRWHGWSSGYYSESVSWSVEGRIDG